MKKIGYIKRELINLYGKDQTNRIIEVAKIHYNECMSLCKDASAGEFMHLENTILPAASFYKALIEVDPENALTNTRNILINLCETGGRILNNILKLPGMKTAFMKVLPKMAIKMFGRECGFDYENLKVTKVCLQMDMITCPYIKYANLLGVPELIPVFCESDFATYGNLTEISFIRNETLGTGGTKCDFKFSRDNR